MNKEFVVVHERYVWPGWCMVCKGNKPPLLDTFALDQLDGRVYLCRTCARSAARVFGFAKGAELERLADAAGLAERAERDMEAANQLAADQSSRIAELEEQLAATVEERDVARGEAEQLAHIAKAIDASARELVTAADRGSG